MSGATASLGVLPTIAVSRSSTDGVQQGPVQTPVETSMTTNAAVDSQWGSNFWVTLADPQTGAEFYACPATGECSWEPPVGNFVLPPNEQGQWWELSDDSRSGLSYYYHTTTGETRWDKPQDSFVIPLRVIQTTTLGRRLSVSAMNKRNSKALESASTPESVSELPEPSSTPSDNSPKSLNSVPESPPSRSRPNTGGSKHSAHSNTNLNGRQTPPSPARANRTSGTPYHASTQQQNLNAAAEIVVRASRSGSTSAAVPSRTIEFSRSAPNFRQEFARANSDFPAHLQEAARRTGNQPRLTVLTDASGLKGGLRSAIDPKAGGLPSPRRLAASVPDRLRPRRNTTTAQISGPVNDRQMPLTDVGGGPILVDNAMANPKRLSTGEHRSLPKNLSDEIQKFQVADFAKRYFTTHRTGVIFRRKVPIEELMSWQKAPLNGPLLVLNRPLHKDAVKIFKIIQRIMGDRNSDRPGSGLRMGDGYASGRESGRESEHGHRSSGTTLVEEERWLLQEGLLHGELRDEIYCQVVKQLSGNPSPESVFRGWQFLCVLVVTFPPSKNFEDYLRSFMRQQSEQTEGRIDVMSKYCLGKLRVIARKGPRGKAPSPQEIEIAQDAAFNPSTFGESLMSVFQLQQRTYPDKKIPIVLPFLADGILALGGMKSEGIFRVPGEADTVADLRLRIDRGFYTLDNIDDPHVPASLFKLWLRELQDPLIPDELYNECISFAEDPERVTQVVAELPSINRRVILFVISFLQNFLDERVMKITKMTAVNLAVIFAPNLLRCNSDSMSVVFTNAKYEQMFVHNLLLHCNCSKMDPDFVPTHGLGPQ